MRKALFLFTALLIFSTGPITASSMVVPTEPDPVVVRSAVEQFNALSKKEKKSKIREARNAIREFKAARKSGQEPDTNTILLVILAILLPPLAVYLHQGEANTKFWITLLLFVLGLAGAIFFSHFLIFAAVVYALIVILGGTV